MLGKILIPDHGDWDLVVPDLDDKREDAVVCLEYLKKMVEAAWQIKENFRTKEFKQTKESAVLLYENRVADALEGNTKEINAVEEMFECHREGIVNAIETGANNAKAER